MTHLQLDQSDAPASPNLLLQSGSAQGSPDLNHQENHNENNHENHDENNHGNHDDDNHENHDDNNGDDDEDMQ